MIGQLDVDHGEPAMQRGPRASSGRTGVEQADVPVQRPAARLQSRGGDVYGAQASRRIGDLDLGVVCDELGFVPQAVIQVVENLGGGGRAESCDSDVGHGEQNVQAADPAGRFDMDRLGH
jgi:hypothetical protein